MNAKSPAEGKAHPPGTMFCSFCGKSQHDVQQADRRPRDLHLQ